MINSGFLVALGGLNLLKAFLAASFLTQAEFGVWSIVVLAVSLTAVIKIVAVGDKYIQQDEDDQVLAFQKSWTLELITAGMLTVLACAIAPLVALLYGERELLAPTLVVSLMLIGMAMQAPIWVFYRRMDFFRQRLYMAVDPVVGFVATIALAIAGAGYWALVLGAIIGSFSCGIVAILNAPIPLRLRYDHGTMKEYLSFSWPLMIAAGSGVVIAFVSVYAGDLALGLAGAGAIGLAGQFTNWTNRADAVITQAMYPAICRVQERLELLQEAFVKSNRLALMWGVPFGVALSVFAGDIVRYLLGPEWEGTGTLLVVFGLIGALNHIGFNWTAFYRARGETRPIAVVNVAALLAFLAAPVPLVFSHGLEGFGVGMAVMTAVSLGARFYYLARLFPGFQVAVHVVRALAPTIPAVAAVLAMRLVEDGRSLELALAEAAVYVLVTIAATFAFERRLLREVAGYVRPAPPLETGLS